MELVIGYILVFVDLIGLILSILVLVALLISLKGLTRSGVYALGSTISFFIGGFFGVIMFITPFPPSPYYVVGWHNILGVLCGYLLLIMAILQYRRDQV